MRRATNFGTITLGLFALAILPLLVAACQTTDDPGAKRAPQAAARNVPSKLTPRRVPARPVIGDPMESRRLTRTRRPDVTLPPPASADAPTGRAGVEIKQAPQLTPPPDLEAQPVRVGLLLPLTGRGGEIGKAMLDAATLALFDVGDERLQLVPRDTGGTPEGAAAAAASVLQDGAALILGPLFGEAARAATAVARERGVQMITFSSNKSVAGNGVYVFGFTPQQQVARIAGYALSRGKTRFAALAPKTPYGVAVVTALQEFLAQYGGVFVRAQYYAPDGANADEAVKRLSAYGARRQALNSRRRALGQQNDAKARRQLALLENRDAIANVDFDAILLPEGGQVLTAVAPLLPYYDIDSDAVQLLGTGLWDDRNVLREPALTRAWFASPTPHTGDYFRDRFESVYGVVAPRIASLAYDAVALAAVLAQAEGGPKFDAEALTTPTGFTGSDGIFRFRGDGVAERGLAVIEIRPDGFKVISAAPEYFGSLTN